MADYERQTTNRQYQRKRKRQREIIRHTFFCVATLLLFMIAVVMLVKTVGKPQTVAAPVTADPQEEKTKYIEEWPELDVQLLPVNPYSRPGTAITKVNGIVVHYTANPGTTAQQNHDYFAGLAQTGSTSASSHFIIGLSGEIIQCIPCDEIAYASNERNSDTIAIECCIEDESGKFNGKTYESLVELTAWLMGRYSLGTDDVIRHYDVTGKNCPKYFVEHEDAWFAFKEDVNAYIEKYGVEKEN